MPPQKQAKRPPGEALEKIFVRVPPAVKVRVKAAAAAANMSESAWAAGAIVETLEGKGE
jgi:predicted HicB family RNase H-like nuclease